MTRSPAAGRRSQVGFSLLEVVLSMALLAMAIASILPLFAVGTASHKRGMDQAMVSLIAPQICARLQENLTESKPADLKDVPLVCRGYTFLYDASFAPLDKSDKTRAAFIVRVTIKWKEAGELRTEPFETILLRRMKRN